MLGGAMLSYHAARISVAAASTSTDWQALVQQPNPVNMPAERRGAGFNGRLWARPSPGHWVSGSAASAARWSPRHRSMTSWTSLGQYGHRTALAVKVREGCMPANLRGVGRKQCILEVFTKTNHRVHQ